MITDRLKFSQEINMYGHHFWVSHEASITPEEDAVECTKQLAEQVNQFCKATEIGKGKVELSSGLISQRDFLIKDLNEATEVKQLTIIHNEAPIEIKADSKFLDAVVANKLRLNSKK